MLAGSQVLSEPDAWTASEDLDTVLASVHTDAADLDRGRSRQGELDPNLSDPQRKSDRLNVRKALGHFT